MEILIIHKFGFSAIFRMWYLENQICQRNQLLWTFCQGQCLIESNTWDIKLEKPWKHSGSENPSRGNYGQNPNGLHSYGWTNNFIWFTVKDEHTSVFEQKSDIWLLNKSDLRQLVHRYGLKEVRHLLFGDFAKQLRRFRFIPETRKNNCWNNNERHSAKVDEYPLKALTNQTHFLPVPFSRLFTL